jgi:hypothetical protein
MIRKWRIAGYNPQYCNHDRARDISALTSHIDILGIVGTQQRADHEEPVGIFSRENLNEVRAG